MAKQIRLTHSWFLSQDDLCGQLARAVSALSSNRKAKIVCAKCGVQSFLRYDACRKCAHSRGFLFLPGHAPPQGAVLLWAQCKAPSQQSKRLAPSLPPVPAAPVASVAQPVAKSATAAAMDAASGKGTESWEASLSLMSAPKHKEEIFRLQTLRSHLADLHCSRSLEEVDRKLVACRKALTALQPEGQRLEQLKESLKRAQAGKDKAEHEVDQAKQLLEEASRGLDPTAQRHLEACRRLVPGDYVGVSMWGDGVPVSWDRSETVQCWTWPGVDRIWQYEAIKASDC